MFSTELVLTQSSYYALNDLLKLDHINEQVGILFGTLSQKKVIIENFIEMENLDCSPTSFSIDYGVLMHYIDKFHESEKQLLGFFHSHPKGKPLFPSKRDMLFMNLWPYPYIWLIGAFPHKLAAFTLLEDKIKQVSFTISAERRLFTHWQ